MISEYFTDKEFECRCGCGLNKTTDTLILLLDYLRDKIGEPVYINSGTRCERHNTAVGGAPRSQHLLGTAADIRCNGMSAHEVHELISTEFPTSLGLGRYNSFTHVDVREGFARW